jgi:hypothetical protein
MQKWVRTADDRLLNLAACSTVRVVQGPSTWDLAASSPDGYNEALGRFGTEQQARTALAGLGAELAELDDATAEGS